MPRTGHDTQLQRLRRQLICGELSPAANVDEALSRSNANASRNTYLWQDRERTLAWAEQLPMQRGSSRPLLYGLPVSLKDCFDLAGTVTSCGTHFYARAGEPAARHSAVAGLLLRQGAALTGKTHLHPLAYGITGENPDFGDCLQPGRPDRLTGGSSSGAAASVLEASAVAAIGTDTGGSIRVPAALCGLAGYRASHAASAGLWRGARHLAPSFDTIGWLYRDLEDGPLLAAALFGGPLDAAAWEHPKIGVLADDLLSDCEASVLGGYAEAQRELASAGATTAEMAAPFWAKAMEIFTPIQAREAADLHAGHYAEFEPAIRERLRWGASVTPDELRRLRARREAFCAEMDVLLARFDMLVMPAAPVAKLGRGADHAQTRGRLLRYTTPASLAGLPVVVIPAASGLEGGGVQLIAAAGRDAALLAWSARLGAMRRSSR